MRRNAKVDINQREIVAGLRQCGCTVLHLHMVGRGCPDLLVGLRGRNYLMEVKQPGKRDDLTPDEERFMLEWNGQVAVITDVQDALDYIEYMEREG